MARKSTKGFFSLGMGYSFSRFKWNSEDPAHIRRQEFSQDGFYHTERILRLWRTQSKREVGPRAVCHFKENRSRSDRMDLASAKRNRPWPWSNCLQASIKLFNRLDSVVTVRTRNRFQPKRV